MLHHVHALLHLAIQEKALIQINILLQLQQRLNVTEKMKENHIMYLKLLLIGKIHITAQA
jgi:hypothetical protein